jgi:phosphatidylglycerophosphate synthase
VTAPAASDLVVPASPGKPALRVIGRCTVRPWGIDSTERHRRVFRRAAGSRKAAVARIDADAQILVRADYLLGEDVMGRLLQQPGVILIVDAPAPARPVAVAAHAAGATAEACAALLDAAGVAEGAEMPPGMRAVRVSDLGLAYDRSLRRRPALLVLSLEDTPLAAIERATFNAAYKSVTDLVTKYCWPWPAFHATRWAAARAVSANTVTTASLVLVALATVLFALGWYLVSLPVAWAMTFLDTVDGKLARVTVTSSRWGNLYDHGIDVIHPPIWWWAWYQGLSGVASAAWLGPALWIVLVGYVAGRAVEIAFLHSFGIQTHVWRPIDSRFRLITARRNSNLLLLTVATAWGRPDLGFLWVAGWTCLSLAYHCTRFVQAARHRLRVGRLESWLSE